MSHNQIYAELNQRNYKNALKVAQQILKKKPADSLAKALMALTHTLAGEGYDAEVIVKELMKIEKPGERVTLALLPALMALDMDSEARTLIDNFYKELKSIAGLNIPMGFFIQFALRDRQVQALNTYGMEEYKKTKSEFNGPDAAVAVALSAYYQWQDAGCPTDNAEVTKVLKFAKLVITSKMEYKNVDADEKTVSLIRRNSNLFWARMAVFRALGDQEAVLKELDKFEDKQIFGREVSDDARVLAMFEAGQLAEGAALASKIANTAGAERSEVMRAVFACETALLFKAEGAAAFQPDLSVVSKRNATIAHLEALKFRFFALNQSAPLSASLTDLWTSAASLKDEYVAAVTAAINELATAPHASSDLAPYIHILPVEAQEQLRVASLGALMMTEKYTACFHAHVALQTFSPATSPITPAIVDMLFAAYGKEIGAEPAPFHGATNPADLSLKVIPAGPVWQARDHLLTLAVDGFILLARTQDVSKAQLAAVAAVCAAEANRTGHHYFALRTAYLLHALGANGVAGAFMHEGLHLKNAQLECIQDVSIITALTGLSGLSHAETLGLLGSNFINNLASTVDSSTDDCWERLCFWLAEPMRVRKLDSRQSFALFSSQLAAKVAPLGKALSKPATYKNLDAFLAAPEVHKFALRDSKIRTLTARLNTLMDTPLGYGYLEALSGSVSALNNAAAPHIENIRRSSPSGNPSSALSEFLGGHLPYPKRAPSPQDARRSHIIPSAQDAFASVRAGAVTARQSEEFAPALWTRHVALVNASHAAAHVAVDPSTGPLAGDAATAAVEVMQVALKHLSASVETGKLAGVSAPVAAAYTAGAVLIGKLVHLVAYLTSSLSEALAPAEVAVEAELKAWQSAVQALSGEELAGSTVLSVDLPCLVTVFATLAWILNQKTKKKNDTRQGLKDHVKDVASPLLIAAVQACNAQLTAFVTEKIAAASAAPAGVGMVTANLFRMSEGWRARVLEEVALDGEDQVRAIGAITALVQSLFASA